MFWRRNNAVSFGLFIWLVINIISPICCDDNVTPTTTTKPTTVKPIINVNNSTLCKKCTCSIDQKFMDCTEKLDGWFTEDEWNILVNGDIVFETIKLEHINLTNIPILPKYGVKNLYLGHNQIDSIVDGAFSNLTELTTLDLSNNKLNAKMLKPDVFQGPYTTNDFEALENLKSLNLGYNELHTLDDDIFEHAPNLEELILCANAFQVIDMQTETAISGLQYLKILDLSYMEIKTLPKTILHGPQELETFIAAGNLFTKLPEGLEHAENLERLVLNENPIGNLEGDNVFPELPKLKFLSLAYMEDIKRIGAGAFSQLQNLTELILSDNKFLEEIDEQAFAKNITGGQYLDYAPLDKLYLNNCNLTKLSRELIQRWDKLTAIDLRYNPWTCDSSNTHIINTLIPQIVKATPLLAKNVQCDSPASLKEMELVQVHNDHLVENAEQGSLVWIGLLVFVLIAIPISLGGFMLYRRGCFGLTRRKDRAASRALYNRASFNEDFHI
ncbi:uncharacterized protein Dwil_GK21955 [Drosophila willistoni]|uniref:GK21955 n=1 Tax=Drosophila willistoni TaxID=7260 RepID=B4MQW6_DROWI|nr:insulin-like growth factor-binding protein complex acid labile subunit [Drosophila willistoni]EDW74505.1 uncharacterized protein Dwil_GK21955 [Drosophila willistoni]